MFLDPSSWLFVLVALLGACVGSFLHVLALRWSEVLNQVPQAGLIQALSGRSACPSCHRTLKAWHMVPVVSFALLRGRCAHCKAPIAWRDTLTECVLAGVWVAVLWRFGPGPEAAAWMLCAAVLLLMSLIDIDTYLLPDVLTLGLVVLGLLASACGWTGIALSLSAVGALCGYGLLALVAWAYRRWRGKEGMGMGDAKLLAAVGAWLGPWSLPAVLWLSALLGLVWGLAWRVSARRSQPGPADPLHQPPEPDQPPEGAFPFGPSLAMAAMGVALTPAWVWAWLGRL